MKEHLITDAITCMDSELIEKYITTKGRLQNQKKKKKITVKKWLAVAACFAIILVSVPLVFNDWIPKDMGDMGEYRISLSEVIYEGQRIEASESEAYLKQHEDEILRLVSKNEHISVDSLRLSRAGIYHVTVTEKSNYINYNMITFFVMDETSAIVSSLDLYRDHDTFNYQVNDSGVCTIKLNEILSQNPNMDFAMIYIGDFVEAVIAPDNTIYFLNAKKAITEDIDYYSLFNEEINLINSTMLE